jgi:hypothetical protein
LSYSTVIRKKRDITSLLGQMCPPAATSASFGELGPVVPSSAGQIVGTCGLPSTAVSGARLVVVHSASSLYRGCGAVYGEGARHWQWGRWLRGEGAFRHFGGLAGEGA